MHICTHVENMLFAKTLWNFSENLRFCFSWSEEDIFQMTYQHQIRGSFCLFIDLFKDLVKISAMRKSLTPLKGNLLCSFSFNISYTHIYIYLHTQFRSCCSFLGSYPVLTVIRSGTIWFLLFQRSTISHCLQLFILSSQFWCLRIIASQDFPWAVHRKSVALLDQNAQISMSNCVGLQRVRFTGRYFMFLYVWFILPYFFAHKKPVHRFFYVSTAYS